MHRAGNTRRISSARSGCRSQYSRIDGFSPRRSRSTKSSASISTGLRSGLASFIDRILNRVLAARLSLKQSRGALHDLAQFLERANVAIAGGRFLDAEHGGRFVVGQFLEVAQGDDLAIHR